MPRRTAYEKLVLVRWCAAVFILMVMGGCSQKRSGAVCLVWLSPTQMSYQGNVVDLEDIPLMHDIVDKIKADSANAQEIVIDVNRTNIDAAFSDIVSHLEVAMLVGSKQLFLFHDGYNYPMPLPAGSGHEILCWYDGEYLVVNGWPSIQLGHVEDAIGHIQLMINEGDSVRAYFAAARLLSGRSQRWCAMIRLSGEEKTIQFRSHPPRSPAGRG